MCRQVAGRIPTGRVPLVVQYLGRRHVHVQPAGRGETISEVHVLHVHEVPLVEPPHLLESGPAQQKAGAGQPADRAFAGLQALLAVGGRPRVGLPDRSDHGVHATADQAGLVTRRRVDGAVGIADQRTERPGARPPACGLQHGVDAAGAPHARRGWPRRRTRSHPRSPGRPGTRQRHGSRRSRSRGWRRCAAAGLLGDVRGPPPARRRWTRCRPSRR